MAAAGVRGLPKSTTSQESPDPGLDTSCLLQDLDPWRSLSRVLG